MTSVESNEGLAVPENSQNSRFHYMDNLRALAMLLGIVFHAALAYSPLMHDMWPGADAGNSRYVDMFAWFSHMFRMPLFFAVSGFFALMMLEKRGATQFLRNRTLRIVIPFWLFLPLTWIGMMLTFGWAIEHVEHKSPVLGFVAYMQSLPDAPQQEPSTTHLWFLYYLFMFCLVFAALHKLGAFRSAFVTKFMASPGFVLLLLPVLLVGSYLPVAAPVPAPEQFMPHFWSFGTNGLYFMLGSLFYINRNLLSQCARFTLPLLLISLLAFAWFYAQLPAKFGPADPNAAASGFNWIHAGQAAVEALVGPFMTVVLLVAGQRFLNRASRTLRFIADSSYWVYIVHLPVLFHVQFVLLDIELNMWLKFAISVFATLAVGVVSYLLLVRYTPLGWLLNGKRIKPGCRHLHAAPQTEVQH